MPISFSTPINSPISRHWAMPCETPASPSPTSPASGRPGSIGREQTRRSPFRSTSSFPNPSHRQQGGGRPGGHGKNTARKSPSVEGALVDRSPIAISALDPTDIRSVLVDVVGEAALLVADDRSAATARQAIAYGNVIFLGPNSVGVDLACRALHGMLPSETVATTVIAYWGALRTALR